MQTGSDTESDSGVSDGREETDLPPPFFDDNAVALLGDLSECSIIAQALEEIKFLYFLDLSASLEEPDLRLLQRSAGVLMKFVTTIPDLMISGENLQGTLFVLAGLLDTGFLDRVLRIRTAFRELVAQSTGRPYHSTTVVIWVDELLWELSLVVPQIAAGFVDLEKDRQELSSLPQSIREQIRNDGLRGVVQLPEHWADMHLALGSPNFSPASKRVALSLMFGSYVLAGHLFGHDPPKSIPDSSNLLASLHNSATQIHAALDYGASSEDLLSKRMSAALLVGLFAVISSQSENKDNEEQPSLLPQRYGCLLDLIIVVLNAESDSFYPLEELDAPPRVLLKWGNTVPWAWSTWPDQRVANTEYIRLLTSTWLCRMDDPKFEGCSHSVIDRNEERAFMKDIPNSSLVVQQLFHDIEAYMTEAERSGSQTFTDLYKLIGKLTWALIQYFEHHAIESDRHLESRTPDFVRQLLLIYSRLALSGNEDLIKRLVLEALSLVDRDPFAQVLESLLSDKSCHFLARLEEVTRLYAQRLAPGCDDLLKSIIGADALLSFLTILLLRDTSNNFELRETIGACLVSVFRYIRREERFGRRDQRLRHTFLTALCACTIVKAKKLIPCAPDDVWLLALHGGKHEIMLTGTFAKYVLMNAKYQSDPLLLYEAWDHFSAALITIVDQQVPAEEEAIALLAVPALCQALRRLIKSCDSLTRRLLASSLRTSHLRKTLKSLMESDSEVDTPYLASIRAMTDNLDAILEGLVEDVINGTRVLDIVTSNAASGMAVISFAEIDCKIWRRLIIDISSSTTVMKHTRGC